MKRAKILDISFYQDNPDTKDIIVDFDKMKLSADGVIFRAGQATWEDKKIGEYWNNSKNKGLLRGLYWYYDNTVSPEKQADLFVSIINKYSMNPELPIFGDFEDRRISSQFSGWNNWYRFMDRMERLVPNIKLGVYTGYYYWIEFSPKEPSSKKFFSKYPLWVAQYPFQSMLEDSFYKEPFIPTETWKSWDFWQVSDRGNGHSFGVESSRVDVNYYNGTVDDLYNEYGTPKVGGEKPSDVIVDSPSEVIPESLVLKYSGKNFKYSRK